MADPSQVRIVGPLVAYAAGFRVELEAQGYRRGPVADQLRLMAHLSRWLMAQGLDVVDLTPEAIDAFLVSRREAGYVLWRSPKALVPLLGHLRYCSALPESLPASPTTPSERLLARYRTYLSDERGLSRSTVSSNVHIAFRLLTRVGDELGTLSPEEVLAYVLEEYRRDSRRSARTIVTGLRSFLRFTYLVGATPRSLAGVVPTVASWRLSGLPRALPADDLARLLMSCDRRTTFGRRDFAVLSLLCRLGLRAGEVAHLRLDDIDWRAGELLIRGKGPKLERLPLPADVGAALSSWLRRGRPHCPAREVFTRVRAPHHALTPSGISAIVRAGCKRAGIEEVNAHRLRHSVATELLARGAGLTEVGQLLRHESLLTTSIYAKVDRAALETLAKLWPVAVTR